MTPLQVTRVAGFGKKPPQSFSQSPVVLGTGAGCNVRFDAAWDKGVAAQHVKLEWIGNYWSLSDLGSPTGTWIDGRKLTQAYPVTGPVEFELGKGGPRCRVEPLAAPAGQPAATPAPTYANAPTQRPAPVYQPRQPSSGPSAPVVAIIAGVVLLIAAGAGWYFLDYRPAELEKEKAALAAAAKVTLPPGVGENPVNPPAPGPTPQPSPQPSPTPTPTNPFKPSKLPDDDNNRAHALGLANLSAEQEQWSRAHFPAAAGVRLNQIGLSRMQSTTYSVDTPAAALGDEIVVRKPGSSTYANDADEPDTVTPAHLPIAVDNSTKSTFPPVGSQMLLSSCGCFSSVYYAASNNIAVARGLSAPVLLSPLWVYNMVNGGGDNGSNFEDVYAMLQYHGAPSLTTVPYPDDAAKSPVPDSIYLKWFTDASVWREALHNRVQNIGTFDALDTPEGLQRLKAYLANGYLANYGTQICDEDKTPHVGWTSNWGVAQSNPALSAEGNAAAGQPVLCCVSAAKDGGHAMTIVGYNDDVWIDFNGDGIVQPEEKGALKIVNSWGSGYPRKKDGGFAWISYDALRTHSQFPWIEQENRIPAFTGKKAWYMLPGKEVKTPALAQFTLSNAARDEIDVRLGVSKLSQNEPYVTWRPAALTIPEMDSESHAASGLAMGGDFAFDGTKKEIAGTFAFDLTYVVQAADMGQVDGYRFYLIVHDLRAGNPTTVSDFRLTDEEGKTIVVNQELQKQPALVDNTTQTFSLDIK